MIFNLNYIKYFYNDSLAQCYNQNLFKKDNHVY